MTGPTGNSTQGHRARLGQQGPAGENSRTTGNTGPAEQQQQDHKIVIPAGAHGVHPKYHHQQRGPVEQPWVPKEIQVQQGATGGPEEIPGDRPGKYHRSSWVQAETLREEMGPTGQLGWKYTGAGPVPRTTRTPQGLTRPRSNRPTRKYTGQQQADWSPAGARSLQRKWRPSRATGPEILGDPGPGLGQKAETPGVPGRYRPSREPLGPQGNTEQQTDWGNRKLLAGPSEWLVFSLKLKIVRKQCCG